MNIRIKTTGAVTLSDEVRTYLDEKLKKIEKLLDPADTSVIADVEFEARPSAKDQEAHRVEINLSIPHAVLRAESSRGTLHAAIDEAIEELRRELRRTKTKHRDLFRRGAAEVKNFFKNFPGL